MNTEDKKRFQTAMVGAGETYSKQITKTLLDIYFESLKTFTIDEVCEAFSRHLVCPSHGTFFPKPADIARLINSNKPTPEQMAELAWMHIEREISRIGAYGTLKMEDKQAIAAVKNMGSWKDLCHMNVDKLPWAKKQFIENYMTFENTPAEMLPSHLPGIQDLHNQRLEMKKAGCNSLSDLMAKMKKPAGIEHKK